MDLVPARACIPFKHSGPCDFRARYEGGRPGHDQDRAGQAEIAIATLAEKNQTKEINI